jgi:BirA family biotin operon repressor/biotin-[acetyl-CoA-carboxylase] ligase
LESTPYRGPVTAERAKAALAGGRFGRIECVDRTGSTNTDLLARARAGDPEQVLVADEQTAGRGRLGRSWQAPRGASLLCSVLVRERVAASDAARVTMALGVAAVDACRSVARVDVGLKWPNDLVAVGVGDDGSDRKVSGMLAESVLDGDRVSAIVAGIGINVDWPDDLPDDLAATATSLRHLAGGAVRHGGVDRVDLLVALLRGLEANLAVDPAALLDAYRSRSATLGREVRIEQAGGTWTGRAGDVTSTGALVVEPAGGGAPREVHAGDVVHLRPLP